MSILVNITLQISDTLATAVSDGPSNNQILLMVSALILVLAIFLWRRYAPGTLRSSFTFDNQVKKAWLLLETEEQKVAFTKLLIEAIKSDSIVTVEEKESFFEEMEMSYRKTASDLSLDEMYTVLSGCDTDTKKTIHFALIEVLYSDGDFDTEEKVWFDDAMKRIH